MAEAMELLAVRPGGLYVDGTVGLGGHARAILERSAPHGQLVGVDRDAETLAEAKVRLAEFGDRVRFVHADYRELPGLIGEDGADGVLLDLGISSAQLDDADRGFSFQTNGPLDMRMDRSRGVTAAEALNQLEEHELADVIYRFGEERRSRRIARAIVAARRRAPFATTGELADLVRRSSAPPARPRLDPATRTFQAFRIYVNRELEGLGDALDGLARRLEPRRAHGRDRVPQPGGPGGEADLPGPRGSRASGS